jgi:hypothetical protein
MRHSVPPLSERLEFSLKCFISSGPIRTNLGICANVNIQHQSQRAGRELIPYFKFWPHFAGGNGYPLPGGREIYEHHRIRSTLWEGEQLNLRMDLMKFILNFHRATPIVLTSWSPEWDQKRNEVRKL